MWVCLICYCWFVWFEWRVALRELRAEKSVAAEDEWGEEECFKGYKGY